MMATLNSGNSKKEKRAPLLYLSEQHKIVKQKNVNFNIWTQTFWLYADLCFLGIMDEVIKCIVVDTSTQKALIDL